MQAIFDIGFTTNSATGLTLTASDGTVSQVTATPQGTISPVSYTCGTGETYTLTATGAAGTTPASATVTPVPTS